MDQFEAQTLPVQPMQTASFSVLDFSGGKTDFYLGAPPNSYKEADNFVIVKYGNVGKLYTRPGSAILNSDHPQIPAGAQRIGTLKSFEDTLFYHSSRKMYYIDMSGFQTLQGPSGNDLFPSGVSTTTALCTTTWNHHLLVANSDYSAVSKIFLNGSAVPQLRTAGLPVLAAAPTVTAGGAGAHNYIYRFIYRYTYTVGTVVFIDRGPPIEVALGSALTPAASSVSITNISVLANSTTFNYDVASPNLVVEIYRTTDNGENFFFVNSVTNGTTTYSDSTTDAALQQNEPLYTEGGVPDNDPPPLCKFVHSVGALTFYGNIKEGSELHTNKILQSVPNDPDSVPATFFTEVEDEVGGLSSAQSYPIAVCTNGPVYRLDGSYDELGNGFIAPQKISQTAGIVSAQSLVQTLEGIFWAGIDGFYYTNGFQVTRVSGNIRDTYQSAVSTAEKKRRIVGKYDSIEKRVYWTAQVSGTDCDTIFALDLNWGISENMPFTTWSGGSSFAPTAIEYVKPNLIRGDKRGYTFSHAASLYTDPRVDTGVSVSDWSTKTITYNYISAATNFGTTMFRKWVSAVTVECKNETNLSLQLTSINDDGRKRGDLLPIRFRGNITWGDPDIYWGDANIIWNSQGLIDERRRMPAQNLRCDYKQIQMTNAKVAIVTSDLLGTCSVDSGAKTATLTNTTDFDWPTVAIDYLISFASDSFSKEYQITDRTNDVITFADPDGTSFTVVGERWVIRGYPKGEVMQLMGYVYDFAVLGKTQDAYRTSLSGEPA